MENPVQFPTYAIEEWPIDRLRPYPRNARVHGEAQMGQLRDSFRKFGQVWPVLARKDGTIIAGHGRLEAAKAEGFNAVRVLIADGWTDEQCRAFGLLDNRVALNAEWNSELLGMELAELQGLGTDLEAIGFEPMELASLLGTGGHGGLTDPDEVPEPPVNPVATTGDLWALGKHRLLCGDCTKLEDTQKLLGFEKPHLMVTDPPYGVDYDPDWRNRADRANGKPYGARAIGTVENDNRIDWHEAWSLFPGSVVYVWHAGRHASAVQASLQAAEFEVVCQIIWAKDRFVISRGDYHWQHEPCWYAVRRGRRHEWSGDRSQTTVWQIGHQKSETGHSTQKPVDCMKRPIENNSSPGQSIYDPFVGSGTTIIAAQMTSRSCYAIEINPAYVDVCIKRWQDFVGEKATLDGDGRTFEKIAAERLPATA